MIPSIKKADQCMVVVFPRGQLTAKDKERLTKSGIVAVEADDPHKVAVLNLLPGGSATVSADDVFMAAMCAVRHGNEGQKFATELHRRLEEKERNEHDKTIPNC